MAKPIRYVICPMCLRNRPLYAKRRDTPTTRKGVFHFGSEDIERMTFLRWCVSLGHHRDGRESGFKTVKEISFPEAVKLAHDERVGESVREVYSRAKEIVALYESIWGAEDDDGREQQ